jgi:predicted nucleic acid-binding Zn ribbon protein
MVTRALKCPECPSQTERTTIGMGEPSRICDVCGSLMDLLPTAPAGFQFKGQGFHKVDYPKSNAQLKKDYGLDKHDSTNPMAEYHEDGYAEEMVSKVPLVAPPEDD